MHRGDGRRMSGKMNLKELYKIMNALASKRALDAALEKIAADGGTDSIAGAIARLSGLNVEQLVSSGGEDAFSAGVLKVHELIFDGIEHQTGRWNENDYWDVCAMRKAGRSFENCFRVSNTAYARSSWYEATKLIKPKQKPSEMKMPDEEMIMQCCIGLHRTENEAVNLMLWANHHPFIGRTQAQTELRRSMYQVLQRPQYCAKQWSAMLFDKAKASDVIDYTQNIRTLIADALMREGWTETEQQKKEFSDLAKRHDHNGVLYKLLLVAMEKRLEGVQKLQCLNKKQLGELLKSLEKGRAFDEISQQDKELYQRIREAKQSYSSGPKTERNHIRLEQILYLCSGLGLSKKDAAQMILKLGYFKHVEDEERLVESDDPADEAYVSGLLKRDQSKMLGHVENPSRSAQLWVYGKLFRRLMDYRSWAGPKMQDAIEKRMSINYRDHADALMDLLCRVRLAGVDAQSVKSGRWIPDEEAMKRLEGVLIGDKMKQIRRCCDQIHKLYAKRTEKLLEACRELGMTRGEALGLLEAAGVKPTPVMKEIAAKQNEHKPADDSFGKAMLQAFMANAEDCMPQTEPDDAAVTAVFNRLIPAAKAQGGTMMLAGALGCYFNQLEYKETTKKLCGELDRLGIIPADRTLMELVKLAT